MTRPRPVTAVLPQKQVSSQESWLEILPRIPEMVSEDHIDRLVEHAIGEIERTVPIRSVGYGWSGGKDSQALRYVCEQADINECVLGISNLEYPEFLRWATDHMPWGLTIIDNGWDLGWLAAHQDMLFPRQSAVANKWFKGVNHHAQDRWVKEYGAAAILLGRRQKDGNYMGPKGETIYTNRIGTTRYSPIADWSHEEVLALLAHKNIDLPPNYFWPRGFRVGTGSWPARQWTTSDMHAWSEIQIIDPSIVREAATVIHSAARFLEAI